MQCDAATKNPPPTWERWPRRGRRGAFSLTAALLLSGALLIGNGGYLKAKAGLSQVLLANAWEKTLQSEEGARPWPWADVTPAAKLEFPRLHASAVVLTGVSGEALAFGPGLMDGSAAPGQPGLTLLAGHRDSHFAFLQHARVGDAITLTGPDGTPHTYTLTETRIVDEDASMLTPGGTGTPTLVLTTCYPFGGLTPTRQRYVAIAQMEDPPAGGADGSGPVAEAKARSGAVAIPEPQAGKF